MTHRAPFDFFTRSAFGIEPGSAVGNRLEAMSSQIILPRGESAPWSHKRDQIVFLISGATKLSAMNSRQSEQIVAFHFGGDIISIAADGVYSYALTSLVECAILTFPAKEFFDEASSEELIARSLLGRIPAALHRCRDKAVALGQSSASERLAGFLLAMNERVGRTTHDGRLLKLPMTRGEIGASLGLTIETISRQFGVLRNAGLIETQGRSLVLLRDVAAIEAMAGHTLTKAAEIGAAVEFDLDQCAQPDSGVVPERTKGV